MIKDPIKYVIQEATIETIDVAIFDWIKDKQLSIQSSEGFVKIPIFWQSAERAYQAKSDDSLRDDNRGIIMPIIYIVGGNYKKDPNMRTSYYAHAYPQKDEKGGTVTYARRIQQDKTSNFKSADINRQGPNFIRKKNSKTVYQVISAPIPISIEVSYKITIKTDKNQHMNTILSSFITDGYNNECFSITAKNGNRYELWLKDFPTKTGDFWKEEERIFEANLEVKALGYIYNAEKNEEKPQVVIRENIVDIKIPRERSSLNEINELTRNSKYKE